MKILIFSGTTEGRKLSGMLSDSGISHTVSVASTYGSDVMPESRFALLKVGRMDEKEMEEYFVNSGFGEGDIVVDATHPYAAAVSENIGKAVKKTGCRLYRIVRGADESIKGDPSGDIRFYDSMEDFAKRMDDSKGSILLTTGSNTLGTYCKNVSPETLARTYVRILPATESIEICRGLGIEPSHVIAMQGPFSYELNRAILDQYEIKHMLTKDSGAAGGYPEKIKAAIDSGVLCHVLSRPGNTSAEDEGYDISYVYEMITGYPYKPKRKIVLAGIGPGRSSLLTGDVMEAVSRADAVFGAASVIKYIKAKKKYDMYIAGDIISVLEKDKDIINAAVLFSGDPSFYSGARKAYTAFKEWDNEADVAILPGISSVSLLAAKTGESYDDAAVISMHGKTEEESLPGLIDAVKHNRKTFALTSSAEDIKKAAKVIKEKGLEPVLYTGCDLAGENECIDMLTVDEAEGYDRAGKITALFINDHPFKKKIINAIPDEEFLRDKTPMTKECIRHESIIRLGLCRGDVVYDIGGGTGAVALEIAAMDPSLKVTTIERDKGAVELIRKNAKRLGCGNLRVVEGDAATVLKDMERPDCVFIGGSGGRLRQIMEQLAVKGEGIRFVINAVSLETIEEARHMINDMGASSVRMVQVSVNDIREAGSHHMMQAQNPVTIFSFTL